jgi:hypothetical protein
MRHLRSAVAAIFGCTLSVMGQAQPSTPSAVPPAAQANAATAWPKDKLEQLVAPIALYPDALLSQVLMAATYPVEIVQAARWQKQNASLQGADLESALKSQTWDPSVKSLCGFASVLQRMSDELDWTQDLGNAFLADKAALMDVVQQMRRKALTAGNFKSSSQQVVTDRSDQIIVVQQASPEVVYVPTYYPTAVYGGWYYPTYYYPPLYAPPPAGGFAYGFAAGVTVGSAMWGGCNWGWGRSDVNINVNQYNTYVNHTEVNARAQSLQRTNNAAQWTHQADHRGGVGYQDSAMAQRYGTAANANHVSGEEARGYASQQSGAIKSAAQNPAAARSELSNAGERGSAALQGRTGGFAGASNPGFDRAASERGNFSRGGGGGGRSGGGGRGR